MGTTSRVDSRTHELRVLLKCQFHVGQDEMPVMIGARSRFPSKDFTEITWPHSHVIERTWENANSCAASFRSALMWAVGYMWDCETAGPSDAARS
jgi:hypothetical protein